jgi:hypothetical protein
MAVDRARINLRTIAFLVGIVDSDPKLKHLDPDLDRMSKLVRTIKII